MGGGFLFLVACRQEATRFVAVDARHSGIDFQNTIIENDSVNVLDFENVYNGGGVGVGDFNNDGLPDLYFTGNLVSNKLYLNQGDWTFRDVTNPANVTGEGRWSRGVAVVDINNDGWLDLYIATTLKKDPVLRENILYINQGAGPDGIPHFVNKAREYGLADTAQSTQAAFFDYDNDGDLDLYLVNNEIIKGDYPNRFRPAMKDGSHPNTDKLYRNDWSDSLGHPVFTNVSREAGIRIDGYGHAVSITDINRDGWKDVYVTNDYLSNDLLWINNQDGTFSEQLNTYFKHTSANAMGSEVADINNDGLMDVVVLDMNPEDNYRKKMMLNPNSYQTYQNSDYFGYGYQYVRNTLQLNRGPRLLGEDSVGPPVFSEIAYYAGMAETDWSWTPVVADFDQDGYRDLIITNGFPKDVTDHDFVAFRDEAFAVASKKQLLEQIPEVKIPNYAYRNTGNLKFEDVSRHWGFTTPSFSNGAVYADLDRDGDLDLVVNNINDRASVYRNQTREQQVEGSHSLTLAFKGDSLNRNALGTWVEIWYQGGQHQVWENSPFRGYLSTVLPEAHFGLGNTTVVDSVIIKWPGDKKQRLLQVKADQRLLVSITDAEPVLQHSTPLTSKALFREVAAKRGMAYVHEERDFIDFNIQKLLPHKLSEYGPGLAAGDVDGNGFEDLVMGGSFSHSGQVFLQQADGRFVSRKLLPQDGIEKKRWEELGILLIDLDGDGDLDVYASSGGYESERNTPAYLDRIYVNDGKGNFLPDTLALPRNYTSKSCVRAADYDRDGDPDLFIAGRVDPWNYPQPVSSYIFRNDTKGGVLQFTEVTASVAPELVRFGMVCDAVFSDYDNDGWSDLVLAGEWIPLTVFKNNKGTFRNLTQQTGVESLTGWWNSIVPGDFDKDGDPDYVAGNIGNNSFYRASPEYPAYITAKDFDHNNSLDAIPSLFIPGADGVKREYPAQTRDDLVKQMISMRTRFQNYKTYANATMDQVITPDQREGALRLKVTTTQSVLFRNEGAGKFTMVPLPAEAQLSMLNGMVVDDFNGDGHPDLLLNGNDYGTEVSVGRYDALNGLLLIGDGKGNFRAASILESGIYIPGNGKALVRLKGSRGEYLVAAAQNRGPLKLFSLNQDIEWIAVTPKDQYALIYYRDGSKERRELNHGASFLSQSSRSMAAGRNVVKVEIFDDQQRPRTVSLQ